MYDTIQSQNCSPGPIYNLPDSLSESLKPKSPSKTYYNKKTKYGKWANDSAYQSLLSHNNEVINNESI